VPPSTRRISCGNVLADAAAVSDTSTCASTHQHAGRVVHRQAHRLTVCVYHVALVNHHAHAHGQPLGPWLGGKSVLTINPRTDGSRG
jgi:hypothetical protein